ncbi:MAG: LysM peptidoglycan-binding domain-containing protein [Microscillaceae bacterium]|nr:LysM peptidoglycan-binding domain-containing protein [Microscillaceae bacterium]
MPNLTGNTPTNPGTGALPTDLGSFTGNPDYTPPGTSFPTAPQTGVYEPQRGSGDVYTTATSSPLILPITAGMNLYTLQNQYNVRKTELKYWNQDKGWNPADNSPKLIEGQTLRLYVPQRLSHPVQPGETLESIAALYDVNWRQIEIWNGFPEKQGNNLLKTKIGQPLIIHKRTGPKPTPDFEARAKANNDYTTQTLGYDPSLPPLTNPQTGYTQPGYPTGTQQPGYTQPGTQAFITHTVRQGEFLYDIAQNTGLPYAISKPGTTCPIMAIRPPIPNSESTAIRATQALRPITPIRVRITPACPTTA